MNKLKLTKEDRNLTVKKLRAKGFTQRVISNRLGISHGTVSNILSDYAYSKKNKFTSLTSRNAYIRKLSKSGRRNKDIARIIGLDPSTVSTIISGIRRPYLTKPKSTPKRKQATKEGANKKAPLTLNRLTVALWVVNAIMLTYIIFNI
jgi:DNA-binding CsgD family transcriptional regulator|tara:strand:- start:190 stop:633 length:444 start_codon:yes stop_codon:yes gene_type:complete